MATRKEKFDRAVEEAIDKSRRLQHVHYVFKEHYGGGIVDFIVSPFPDVLEHCQLYGKAVGGQYEVFRSF